MASFGQLTNAFFRASQETSIGLANVNFDFSVIKYDAPREYQGLGEALSKRRRETAEDGPLHITARKLGALFQSAWPKVPSLIQAYGLRSSEIANLPEVNPQGSVRHGLFADHVGADGTTIWAAATSGGETVTVHLLACMLARIWRRDEAVSIWSELVDARKVRLEEHIAASEFECSLSDLTASRIDISRAQLDAWDASARAWLQCADAAKALQQTQLRLLVDNISLPISPQGSLYNTVVDTAAQALQALNCLVRGVPQQIDKGSVLLGLSSWHLYPDVLVASTNTHIRQVDGLIASGGIITIGLESKDGDSCGVSWSLPLAQAKYYGDPVLAKRHLGVEQSRVPFQELQLVVLGSILSQWDDPSLDLDKQMEYIQRLSIAVRRTMKETVVNDAWYRTDAKGFDWLHSLGDAAETYSRSKGVTRTQMSRLVALGKRRCIEFLGPRKSRLPPISGLANFQILMKALNSANERIQFLTSWADKELDPEILPEAVILYYPDGEYERVRCTRLVNATPSSRDKRKLNQDAGVGHAVTWTLSGDKDDDPYNFDNPKEFLNRCMIPSGPGEPPALHMILCGDVHSAVIYVPLSESLNSFKNDITIPQFFHCIEEGNFPTDRIAEAIGLVCKDPAYRRYFESLNALTVAAKACYASPMVDRASIAFPLFLESMFSCIAYFETCMLDINPRTIGSRTFAICHDTSIFVAASLLNDPAETTSEVGVERLVGNIGKPGLAFLVSPASPRIRKLDYSSWHMVSHNPFDGMAEDNLRGTSMHLSFTGYELPLDLGQQGNHETPAYFLETAISVYDGAKWVADVDIFEPSGWNCIEQSIVCDHDSEACEVGIARMQAVSIDSWVELLDPPTETAVVRAYKNPIGRLAALALAMRQSANVGVVRGDPCWACIGDAWTTWEATMALIASLEAEDSTGDNDSASIGKGEETEEEQEQEAQEEDEMDVHYGTPQDNEEEGPYALNPPASDLWQQLQGPGKKLKKRHELSSRAGNMIFIY
ncbi:nucleolar complex-associated protein [Apiospora arundinis]